ncbi:MAG TPA: peroxidase-related enzyme [Cyclobacteriaceae bacterium]|nr:peroxidase-related enzyme [Cyclobacteriaceae bacterium]
MAYISVPEGVPGIRSLVTFRPESGKSLYALAQILLRGESPLTPAERELIATHVSSRNDCTFCMMSHAAAARELFGEQRDVVDCVITDVNSAPLNNKMKALLNIAAKVQQSGKLVTQQDIDEARKQGANDRDIHDTVLIAATFSMFNRYVDGLASFTPTDPKAYEEMGKRMTTLGYVLPQPVKN